MSATALCDAAASQLVVIDVQERLAAAMPGQPRAQLLENTARLIQAAATLGIPRLHTEQYPQGLGPTEPALEALLTETAAIEKTCFSCHAANGFMAALQRHARRQIILTGMETHVCVLQTALQLQQADYQVFVVQDAVCSRHKLHHKNALARLRRAGVIVSNHESVLFEWLRDASHPQFKILSRLVR
jgi:nicotinamidase-related amidase